MQNEDNNYQKKDALIFSQIAQMKFKPSNCQILKIKNQQGMSHLLSQIKNAQSHITQSTPFQKMNKRLKYLYSIDQNHFLIGNQNQLDLIGISGASHGFIDTQYFWSLALKTPILQFTIDIKKCHLALVTQKNIHIYFYNHKKLNQLPKLAKLIQTKNQIRFVQFPKELTLSVFYSDNFQVYSLQQSGQTTKKAQKSYGVPSQFKLFSVPQAIDSVQNIFFCKQNDDNKTFSLWNVKIVYQLVEIRVYPKIKVYDIMKNLKKSLTISNFSKDTFFLNMGCQIIAAKKGFIIDSINVNIQGLDSKLIYISHQRLLHIDDHKVQIYQIKIDKSVKPNRLKIKSIDSLQVSQKPQNSKFLDLVTLGKQNFAIFFQLKTQLNRYKNGQINYWFALTQPISKDSKIRTIFNYGTQISTLSPEIIQSKCDMARKLGLTQKQIYLQIWNRTSKSTIEDYKFLLATNDFKTIHSQIQKKLKKTSMSFRQLLNIYSSSINMLHSQVYSPKCTQQNIQQYLTCHLLIRKLKLFKQMQIYERQNSEQPLKSKLHTSLNSEADNKFMINIQQFYEYKNFDIKGFLIQHVSKFCNDKKNCITRIRLILRAFRFIFKYLYRQLLDQIIQTAKYNLLSLLQALPELLPHNNYLNYDDQVSLYEGVWKQIDQSTWQSNLYLDNIKTIDNSDKVDDLIKGIWYKRYWLTTHDLINKTRHQIQIMHQKNSSDQIFYYFISSLFQKVQNSKNLEVIIQFLQNFYDRMPSHIKGKVFLYVDLFKYYNLHSQKTKRNTLLLNEFLKLQGTDLFKYFFDLQKVRKNCILKQIKPIYQNSKGQYKGTDVFNRDLLEYFESDSSQLSHLKYLLNRMNNQKAQFHSKNIQTYQILVQAMQIKLIIGGPNDIPIEQVLVYIQNIPLSRKDSEVMAQLQIVQRINDQAHRFRQMKINMSIRQIIDKCQDVISKLIQYQFKKNKISKIKDIKELKTLTYQILAQIQTVKQKIYGQEMSNLPFFIYICQVLQNQQQIQLANQLLKDQYLNRYFTINQTIIQNLVLFMYKKRFSISAIFKDHQSYIRSIVTLLNENSSTKQFILSQLTFALLLSAPGQGIEFPISDQNPYPKINQLMDIVNYLPAQFILTVDILKVYEQMKRMHQIEVNSDLNQSAIGSQIIDQEFLTLHQIYQVFINRMIDLNLIHQAIPYIRQICTLQYPNEDYNSLYLIILILKISPQLNDECKHGLSNIISYAFEDQQQIIKVLQFYINQKMTSLQKGIHIRNISLQIKKNKINYNLNGKFLFKNTFKDQITNNPQILQNAKLIIQTTWIHLRNCKQQFKDPFYQYCYIILCHQPYLLVKLIYLLAPIINYKVFRSFISYLSQQQLFDQNKVLEYSKRMFYLVLESKIQNKQINNRLFSIQQVDFSEHVYFKEYFGVSDELQIKIQKSFKGCENKSKILINLNRSRKSQKSGDASIQIKIHHPQQISQSAPSQYPFQDSDDDVQGQQKIRSNKTIRAKAKRAKIVFDQKSQRNKFMNRQSKKLGNYLKQHTQTQRKSASSHKDGQSPRIKSRVIQDTPLIDKQIKVKKAMTLSYNPDDYRNKNKLQLSLVQSPKQKKKQMILNIIQSPVLVRMDTQSLETPDIFKRKQGKYRRGESFSFRVDHSEQKNFNFDKVKQQSNYSVNQNSDIGQCKQTCENILQQLFQQYDIETKTFNLQKLKTRSKLFQDEQAIFIQQLKRIISILYDGIDTDTQLKTNLIKSISKVFPQVGISPSSQALYIQLITLLNRYNLNISITKILPVDGLFMQTGVSSIFQLAKPNIIQLINNQNLNKLSKVISLSFRKNQFEQQIAYLGLCKILQNLQQQNLQQVQINLHFDEFQTIINKLSTKMLKQKSQQKFKQIKNGKLKQKFIQLILLTISKKGDKSSVDYIKNNMNKKSKFKDLYQSNNQHVFNIRIQSVQDSD